MADELPVDEAAFHAAIMAINNAIDGIETKATLRGIILFFISLNFPYLLFIANFVPLYYICEYFKCNESNIFYIYL